MKKRVWLLLSLLLLALAAFLMSRGDRDKIAAAPPKVTFPRRPKPEEDARRERRRTLPPAPEAPDATEAPRKRDPLLWALPSDPKKSAMVFEVAELTNSPVGQAWLDCMLARGGEQKGRTSFKESFGIDPLEDVERVAVSSERVAVLSIAPGAAKFDKSGWPKRAFGDGGTIYEQPDGNRVMATWGGDIVLAGQSTAEVEAAIRRLEAKAPPSDPAIPEWSTYGDIYGVLSPEDLAAMLPPEQAGIAAQVESAVRRVHLHVDASEDVAMVADVEGAEGKELEDLSKTMGVALSVARATAEEKGNERLSELLEYAAVHPQKGGKFALDVALPFDVLKAWGPCRKRSGDGGR
jgi:hypothetical protein